jgi:hypothetical protein
MSEPFRITYTISEEQWAATVRRRYAPESEPIFDAFYGDVRIEAGDVELFADGTYHMSVADLACGLAEILRAGFPHERANALFRQADDSLELSLHDDGQNVTLQSDSPRDRPLRMMRAEFVGGVRRFIAEFVGQASERVPDLFGWKDLRLLQLSMRPRAC